MRPLDTEALDRWLAAERDGRDDGDGVADGALRELFAALPLAAPPAGFADRVMVRVSLPAPAMAAPSRARRDVFAWRPLRAVLALCVLATGFGALWLPQALRAVAGLWSFSGAVEGGTRLLIDGAGWLAALLRTWDFLLTLERALTQPLAAPQVTALLLGALLASSLAFRFLRDQITGERWTHVDPI
jgi:hypothetical protein